MDKKSFEKHFIALSKKLYCKIVDEFDRWTIKGFIDMFSNVYTISQDTKIISKILGIIYCDPPYIDRHSDYYDSWSEKKENKLAELLKQTQAKFVLSTRHHNQHDALAI